MKSTVPAAAPAAPAAPAATRRDHAGLFLAALATLMYEVLLTRVFSVTMWYHFAFMAISIAMFGMTFGAVAVYLRPAFFSPGSRRRQLALFSLAFALGVVLSFLAHLSLPRLLADGDVLGRKTWLVCVAATFLVTLVPFVCGGIVVTLSLTGLSGKVGRLYAADLAGAALGCLAILGLLTVLDGPSAVFCVAAVAAAGAVCFAPKADSRTAWAGFVLMSALAALSVGMSRAGHPLIQVRWTKAMLETPPLFEKWNSFSRLRIEGDTARPSPRPFGWGMSPAHVPARPVYELSLNIDASAATPLTRFTGDTAELGHLKHDVTNLAHHLRRDARVLVVGVGGGRDVLSALAFGQRSVLGVELNGDILAAVNGRFGDFTGHIDRHPKVTLVNDEARSFVARVPDRYDILQVSLVDTWAATASGAFVLSESSLYTVEAWDRFLDRLTPGGILSFSRWYYRDRPGEMYRLVSLAAESLRRAGAARPRDHMLMARLMWPSGDGEVPDGVGTLLVGREPFTAEDIAGFKRTAAHLGFDLALTPAETIDTVFAALAAESGSEAFLKSHPLDLSAPTDNRPFFFHMLRLRNALDPQLWRQGAMSMNLTAVAVLAVLLALVLVLTALAVILPLRLAAGKPGPGTPPLLVYFLAIGLAFMLVEIAQMQRLNLFLGHPTFALSTVLFTLLLSGGAGSWLSGQPAFAARGRLCLGFLLAATAVSGAFAPLLIASLQDRETPVRVLASVALLFPMGLGMGMAFPMGMRWASLQQAALGPWLWGVNGAASVCASVLAIALSMTFGISATYWMGFACYAAAAAAWLAGGGQGEDRAPR